MEKVRVAFLTYDQLPQIGSDDHQVEMELLRRGIYVDAVPWKTKDIDWQKFDAIIIRSCWDYHLYPQEFIATLNCIDKLPIPVFNPISTILWNLHKGYLDALSQQGVIVPKSKLLTRGSSVDLAALIGEEKWTSAVIKPCISASSHNTWVTTRRTASQDNAALNKLLQHQDLIIQEFVDEICSNGEISLMFFDGTYSHSVIKKPTPGDFRVQETFGGKTSAYAPRSETIEKAAEILQLVNGELLYARVDGVEKDGAFCLMELELIEPVLFFRHGPHSAKVFAEAMERLLQKV